MIANGVLKPQTMVCRFRHVLPRIAFPQDRADELGRKLCAEIMFCEDGCYLVAPSEDEWIGVNLLERDDEL